MKVNYIVTIESPENHMVKVNLIIDEFSKDVFSVFLPSWSPGSYLMREYARHVRKFNATQANGEPLFYTQIAKGIWEIDKTKSSVKNPQNQIQITYDIYCKDLTVRTSHVDASHAFLHGPSYLMGILNENILVPKIEFRFPPLWSRLSTSLKDISPGRESFLYEALDYDILIDTPVEIGCHETDGFEFQGKSHHLAFYGNVYSHKNDLKKDIKKVVETVASHFANELPYEEYLFITHFCPKIYGGLEHLNSTVLHFDGRKLSHRKDYLSYLSLLAHEYFHLWNVKRIRPKELGPFDYLNEAYTNLLWLAEGLTSFMDDLFVYRAGISDLSEYLETLKSNLDTYLSTPGRYFHSLEQSSFNAWIKLYRPDENSKNSSVSYYLKGGLVFLVLHALLFEKGKSIDHLLWALWEDFKIHPERGVTKDDIYRMIREIGGDDVLEKFSIMIETTHEINFDSALRTLGLEMKWNEPTKAWLGVDFEFTGDRVFIKTVILDSPAYKSGLNAGDEILFVNHQRFLKEDADKIGTYFLIDQAYLFTVSRLNTLREVSVLMEREPRRIKEIVAIDQQKAQKALRRV